MSAFTCGFVLLSVDNFYRLWLKQLLSKQNNGNTRMLRVFLRRRNLVPLAAVTLLALSLISLSLRYYSSNSNVELSRSHTSTKLYPNLEEEQQQRNRENDQVEENNGHQDRLLDSTVKYPRTLNDDSPFKIMLENLKSNENGINIYNNWNDKALVSRTTQCKHLINAIYEQDASWSNQAGYEAFKTEEEDAAFSSLEAERIRIFNYCFIFGDVNPRDIFNDENLESSSPTDFQNRIYPFLKKPEFPEVLLPKMFNLSNMQPIKLSIPETISVEEFNDNFFSNWIQMSKGRGIITTFSEKHLAGYFYKLLTILQHIGNKLPIQILVHEEEYSDEFKGILSEMGKKTDQQLILVTYTNLLAPKNLPLMKKYVNKLLASLFNTFEEYILLDVDVVPFVDLEEYFEYDEYKKSGQFIARDRELAWPVKDDCRDILKAYEPTIEEVNLIKTSLMTTFTSYDPKSPEGVPMELVSQKMLHIVESGLVVANKRTNFAGMLMTLSMNLNNRLGTTYLGDKEFFWFGQLYAGQSFAFEPSTAALLGFPIKEYDDAGIYKQTTVCDAHIGHAHKGKLGWTNSGLDLRKAGGGINDRNENNPRMRLNGFIMPDREHGDWRVTNKGYGQLHCGTVVEPGAAIPPNGEAVWFDVDEYNRIDKISKLWHDAFYY